jgi:Ca2+-binding RTX toxin-like protein
MLTMLDVTNGTSSVDGGASGNDTLSVSLMAQEKMSTATKGLFVNLSNADYSNGESGDKLITIAKNSAKFTVKVGTSNSAASVSVTNIDSILGTKFDDYLVGSSGTNYFEVGAGNDIVFGMSDTATYMAVIWPIKTEFLTGMTPEKELQR